MNRSPQAVIIIISVSVFLLFCGCASTEYVPAAEAAAAYYNLGNAYTELERNRDAVTAFTKALELDPGLLSAGFNLARVYIILGEYEQSIEQLDQLAAEDPQNRSVLEMKAWVFHLQGEDQKALGIYDSVLAGFSGSRNSLYNSAVLLSGKGEFEKSLERFERYVSLYPDEQTVIFEIAKIQTALENYEGAFEWAEKYLELNPDDLSAIELTGDLQAERNLYADAVRTYRRITETETPDEDNSAQKGRVYFKMAEILLKYMEDSERGLAALENSVKTGWKEPEYYDRLLSVKESSWYDDVFKLLGEGESAAADSPADEN